MREASSTPTKAAQRADSNVGDEDHPVDVDAGKAGRFRIRADREKIAAPAAVMQKDVGGTADQDHHPEQVRKAEESLRARKPGEAVVVDRMGAIGHQKADAAQRCREWPSVMMKGGSPILTMPKP